jgi:hypothetical protein
MYFKYGTIDTFMKECKSLTQNIEVSFGHASIMVIVSFEEKKTLNQKVYLDDKLIKLPDLESIVVLNISSWGAGCRVWANQNDPSLPIQR